MEIKTVNCGFQAYPGSASPMIFCLTLNNCYK